MLEGSPLMIRTLVLLRRHRRCVVPGCWVWSLVLDARGMCPAHLWDDRHHDYAAQLAGQRDGGAT